MGLKCDLRGFFCKLVVTCVSAMKMPRIAFCWFDILVSNATGANKEQLRRTEIIMLTKYNRVV